MKFASAEKTFIASLLIVVIAGGFVLTPLSAEATVPVVDDKAIGVLKDILKEETFQSGQLRSLVRKEYVLDPAVKSLAALLLQALTRLIIQWVQSGGNTNFVSNLQSALFRVADEAAGEFLNQLAGANLCSPFANRLRGAFQRPSLNLSSRLTCTATDIFRNIQTSYEDFLRDFGRGGWLAYQSTMTGGNNYIDALINSYDAKLTAESRRVSVLRTQYDAGQGFLGVRVKKQNCQDFPEYENPICTTVDVQTTPGKLVVEQVSHVFNSGIDQAVNADEIAEAIDAIISLLINQLISSAQAGLASNDERSGLLSPSISGGGGAAPPPAPPPPPPEETRIKLDIELAKKTIRDDIDPALSSIATTTPLITAALNRFATSAPEFIDARVTRLRTIRTELSNVQVRLISSKAKLNTMKDELEQIRKDIAAILSKPNEIPVVDLADLYSRARELSRDIDNEVNDVVRPNVTQARSLIAEALLLIPEVNQLPASAFLSGQRFFAFRPPPVA